MARSSMKRKAKSARKAVRTIRKSAPSAKRSGKKAAKYNPLGQVTSVAFKAGQTVAKKLEAKKQAAAKKRIAAAHKRVAEARKKIEAARKRLAAERKAEAKRRRIEREAKMQGAHQGRKVKAATPTKTKKPLPTLGSTSSKLKKPKNGGRQPSRQSQRKQR